MGSASQNERDCEGSLFCGSSQHSLPRCASMNMSCSACFPFPHIIALPKVLISPSFSQYLQLCRILLSTLPGATPRRPSPSLRTSRMQSTLSAHNVRHVVRRTCCITTCSSWRHVPRRWYARCRTLSLVWQMRLSGLALTQPVPTLRRTRTHIRLIRMPPLNRSPGVNSVERTQSVSRKGKRTR